MGTFQAAWEDDENNRRVDLVVGYQVAEGQVEIGDVTPHRVHFRCEESGDTLRTIGIHTESGKQMLLEHAVAAGAVDRIRHHLNESDVHDIRHDAEINAATNDVPAVTV